MAKTIDEYLKLPYTIELITDPSGGYAVAVKELPGCISQGDTVEEAMQMIRDAMAGWIDLALEDGLPIPEPRPEESYSGKFVVRVPKSLHRRLAERSEIEGVSLNQYINAALSNAVSSEKSADQQQRVKADLPTTWPGLSDAAAMTLRVAGLDREAGIADERLLAAWLERIHNSVERAYANEYYQEAIRALEGACAILEQNRDRSPFMQSLAAMLELQIHLIETSVRMEKAVVRQALDTQPQIQERIWEVYQSTYQAENISREKQRYLRSFIEKDIVSRKSDDLIKLFGLTNDE
jgi:antitoxin HicB